MTDHTPHTHQVKIQQMYPYSKRGRWAVTYGDTEVKVHFSNRFWARFFDPEPRIHKAVAKAIAKHDEGSQRLVQMVELEHIAEDYNKVVRTPPSVSGWTYDRNDAWGTDLLKEKVTHG